jgi:hypothetical protein
VTEAEWLACTNPKPMLEHLRLVANMTRREAGRRKLRLFGCACCRRVWHLMVNEADKRAVEVAEQFADGRADEHKLLLAHNLAPSSGLGSRVAEFVVWATARVWEPASVKRLDKVRGTTSAEERRCQADLLRDIFGNPFGRAPSVAPAWLAWDGGTVPKLAAGIYRKRTFDRLPVLADALEEAGCTDAAILGHCRGGGEHVRGCWVIDLLLGKA